MTHASGAISVVRASRWLLALVATVVSGVAAMAALVALYLSTDGGHRLVLMAGGFALVAAPADYLVSGVKTFIVSHDGVVYEKDLGPETLEAFRGMERYNPDETWTPTSVP